jgi:hypothetical protein
MSYILDALRKSERQHRLARELVFLNVAQPYRRRFGIAALVVAAGVALLAAAGSVLYLWRDAPPEPMTVYEAVAPRPEVRGLGVHTKPATPPPVTEKPPRTLTGTALLASPGAGADTAPARFLRNMSQEFQRRLPPLVVNIHVYSPEESQRVLYINNRAYRKGEQIEGGIAVEEIVPDGVVLRYHGQRFKLPRPS